MVHLQTTKGQEIIYFWNGVISYISLHEMQGVGINLYT